MRTYQNILLQRVRDIAHNDLMDSVTFETTVEELLQVELYNETYRALGNPTSIVISNASLNPRRIT